MTKIIRSPAVEFSRDGSSFILETRQLLPAKLDSVFPFFAEAENLERITPPLLQFRIVTPTPIEMRTGIQIEYALKLHGFPMKWLSHIALWDPPNRFVDEQVRGPYKRWWHEHAFFDTPDGTLVHDRIEYQVYGGPLIERVFVRGDLHTIFSYRRMELARTFPEP